MSGYNAERIPVIINGNEIRIGQLPQLVVNLDTQNNFIETGEKRIPYRRKLSFSPDLLLGKRPEVFYAAAKFYYEQASAVAEGYKVAEDMRGRWNTTVREIKRNETEEAP